MEEEKFNIDFDVVLDLLDQNLPQIPGRPVVQQVNPFPYKNPIRLEYGKLMPSAETDPKNKKNKPNKPP